MTKKELKSKYDALINDVNNKRLDVYDGRGPSARYTQGRCTETWWKRERPTLSSRQSLGWSIWMTKRDKKHE